MEEKAEEEIKVSEEDSKDSAMEEKVKEDESKVTAEDFEILSNGGSDQSDKTSGSNDSSKDSEEMITAEEILSDGGSDQSYKTSGLNDSSKDSAMEEKVKEDESKVTAEDFEILSNGGSDQSDKTSGSNDSSKDSAMEEKVKEDESKVTAEDFEILSNGGSDQSDKTSGSNDSSKDSGEMITAEEILSDGGSDQSYKTSGSNDSSKDSEEIVTAEDFESKDNEEDNNDSGANAYRPLTDLEMSLADESWKAIFSSDFATLYKNLSPNFRVGDDYRPSSKDYDKVDFEILSNTPSGSDDSSKDSEEKVTEEFESLSLVANPGSVRGYDNNSLPRPLYGDEEPYSFAQMYPMNCHCRYLRLTTSAIPNSQSLVWRWNLPLGAVVCPFAEAPDGEKLPLIDIGLSTGILRCKSCETYLNPYVTLTHNRSKWRCNICSTLNKVTGKYFSYLDIDQYPELTEGSVEIRVPTEDMVGPAVPPIYFFLIDVSNLAAKTGMLKDVAQTIKSCLDNLPGYPRTQIGFITHDKTLHFYSMKSSLSQPQMMVVSDLDDIFVPLPDDLLVNLSESRIVVEAFLDKLPSLFKDNDVEESAFGPALKAAFMVMKQLGGKLLIFQSSLPSLGFGRFKPRGTENIYTTKADADAFPFYRQMAVNCAKFQIGIDVYALGTNDIATLGTLAQYTGGEVYYYRSFNSADHGDKFRCELARDLTRETAWNVTMQIKCGKGIRVSSYHGNFRPSSSTDLLALPPVDCDKAFAMQLSIEEALLTTQTAYFQVALQYTASCGERRVRVHTSAAPVVSDLGEMYRQADTGSIVSVLTRTSIERALSTNLVDARNAIQQMIVNALKEYHIMYCHQHWKTLGYRVMYPDSLRFLPLYGLAITKSTPLRGCPSSFQDEICADSITMMALPVKKLLKLLYPSLFRVDEWLLKPSAEDEDFKYVFRRRLPLAAESLESRGLYMYDDGFKFVFWFGRTLSPEIITNLVGGKETEMVKKLKKLTVSTHCLCFQVREGDEGEGSLLKNCVDDGTTSGPSYKYWMMGIDRLINRFYEPQPVYNNR